MTSFGSPDLCTTGTEWRWFSWLNPCATSLMFTCSIPDGFTGIFHSHYPSGRTVTLGSTQPLKEMSTRNTSWGDKGGPCLRLTTLPHSCADCLEIWVPQLPGTLMTCPGLLYLILVLSSLTYFVRALMYGTFIVPA